MSIPKRRSTRLKNYDYSKAGAYFITICTQDRRNILSEIVGEGSPLPKRAGKIAVQYIEAIHTRYPEMTVDKYVVMPNHIHLLLAVVGCNGRGTPPLRKQVMLKK